MPPPRPPDFARILDFFANSSFDYLALDACGQSLRLERADPRMTSLLTAPGIGTVVATGTQTAMPRPGDRVARGQTLFGLRRFKTVLDVRSPCDGEVAAVDVAPGQFVEFGETLLQVIPAR